MTLTITRDEYLHMQSMAGATWYRNAVRWAGHLASQSDEMAVEVANTLVTELPDGTSWSELPESEQFKLVNRIVSRFQQQDARDGKRFLYADRPVHLQDGRSEKAVWDTITFHEEWTDPAETIDFEPMTESDLVDLFVEHGIQYKPAPATVSKLLAWANAPAGASKVDVSRSLGLGDQTIAQAIYEIKRWGLKAQEVTA